VEQAGLSAGGGSPSVESQGGGGARRVGSIPTLSVRG